MNLDMYLNYINSHMADIAKYTDNYFERLKDYIYRELKSEIISYITPVPTHYEWEWDGCPWDNSGQLREEGKISLDQTVEQFLMEEYTGNKIASYCSGCGFFWLKYKDILEYKVRELSVVLMVKAIKEYLEKEFSCVLSRQDMDDLWDITDCWNDIYDYSMLLTFDIDTEAVKFVGLDTVKLYSLIS